MVYVYIFVYVIFTDDVGRSKITAEKHILCYLWLVGHESKSYRRPMMSPTDLESFCALYNIITRVTDFILSFAKNVIKYPNAIEKAETAVFYQNIKGFPGVIGNIHSHLNNLNLVNILIILLIIIN